MKAIVRICDSVHGKYTGFELSEPEYLTKLLYYDFGIGTKFNIGNRELEIMDISIDGFYKTSEERETLDNQNPIMNCRIWLYCKCDDVDFLAEGADYSGLLKEISSMKK